MTRIKRGPLSSVELVTNMDDGEEISGEIEEYEPQAIPRRLSDDEFRMLGENAALIRELTTEEARALVRGFERDEAEIPERDRHFALVWCHGEKLFISDDRADLIKQVEEEELVLISLVH